MAVSDRTDMVEAPDMIALGNTELDTSVRTGRVHGCGRLFCPTMHRDALWEICAAAVGQKQVEVQYASGTKATGQRHSLEQCARPNSFLVGQTTD